MSRTRYRTEADELKHRQETNAKEMRYAYCYQGHSDKIQHVLSMAEAGTLLFLMLIKLLCVSLLCLFAVFFLSHVNLGLHLIIFI